MDIPETVSFVKIAVGTTRISSAPENTSINWFHARTKSYLSPEREKKKEKKKLRRAARSTYIAYNKYTRAVPEQSIFVTQLIFLYNFHLCII